MQHGIRTLSRLALGAGMFVTLVGTTAYAQADNRPTVAVLDFTNGSFGPGRADYNDLGKGIQDFLITELAGNARIRVVERDRIQQIIKEQDLCKDGRCDDASVVKIGKLLGAHHMIAGGFIVDTKGNMVLNARAFRTETSEIEHTDKVSDKSENFLAAIANLANRMNSGMKLPDNPRRTASAAPITKPAATPVSAPAEKATATNAAATSAPAPAATVAAAEPAPAAQKVPYAAIMLYSKALSAKDKGDRSGAVSLFKQAIAKFPDFEKAKTELKKVEG